MVRLPVLLLAVAGVVARADGGAAADAARRALAEGSAPSANRFRLEARGERHGCAFVPGPNGLVDGELAFTDGQRTVTFRGFDVWVGGGTTAGARPPAICDRSPLVWRFSEEKGVLRLRISCETTNAVSLALGPADEKVFRAYGGTGYVVENPRAFEVTSRDLITSRAVGADYANGLSVVQASDILPERIFSRGDGRQYGIVVRGRAFFAVRNMIDLSFAPSSRGAFAAARRLTSANGVGEVAVAQHGEPSRWVKADACSDAERVPWHDVTSHNVVRLAGGGFEADYAGAGRTQAHGYSTDDYFCTTVMGGRAPLCDVAQAERSRYTYSMLGDLMRDFGRATFESLTFGPTIHQMHVVFSDGCEAWVNRSSSENWDVPGWTLPPLGFYAKSPKHESGVVIWDTRRIRFSEKKVYNP